jgi:hypothetical protein
MTDEVKQEPDFEISELMVIFLAKRGEAKARKEEIRRWVDELRQEYLKLDEEIALYSSALEKMQQGVWEESLTVPTP